jgi:hypothetical protein
VCIQPFLSPNWQVSVTGKYRPAPGNYSETLLTTNPYEKLTDIGTEDARTIVQEKSRNQATNRGWVFISHPCGGVK